MNLIYEKGRVRLYYVPADKFKTETISIFLCPSYTGSCVQECADSHDFESRQ